MRKSYKITVLNDRVSDSGMFWVNESTHTIERMFNDKYECDRWCADQRYEGRVFRTEYRRQI